MKVIKRILRITICIPLFIILFVIVYELFGMVVNHAATTIQTKKLTNAVKEIEDLKVINTYSRTGNTSGTGNHVDMMTILIVQTDEDITYLQECLKDYADMDEWSFYISPLSDVKKAHEKYGYLDRIYDQLEIPEQNMGYLVYCVDSAPFADNIEGH